MTDNSQNANNLQERNEQVLKNISQLQAQEKKLYNSLDDVNLSSEQKKQVISKINEISQMRINLYSRINDIYKLYQTNVSESEASLEQQILALDILEKELNQSKHRMNLIEEQKNNKLRLVEINTYYSKKYQSYSKILKTIFITCLVIILLVILNNVGILPPIIPQMLISVVLVIGGWIVGLQIIKIYNKSNMNWDEYSLYFNQKTAPSPSSSSSSSNSSSSTSTSSSSTSNSSSSTSSSTSSSSNSSSSTSSNTNSSENFEVLEKYGNIFSRPHQSLNNEVSPV